MMYKQHGLNQMTIGQAFSIKPGPVVRVPRTPLDTPPPPTCEDVKTLAGGPGFMLWAIVLMCLLLPGCGYRHAQLYPEDVHTVAVPIFGNRSFYRDIERDLTEALIKEIELRTPYKVVARAQADTIIEGMITKVDQTTLSRSREGGLPAETQLQVRANLHWKDLRSGKTLRHRPGQVAVGRYIPSRAAGESYQVASRAAVQRMARDFVAAMRGDW